MNTLNLGKAASKRSPKSAHLVQDGDEGAQPTQHQFKTGRVLCPHCKTPSSLEDTNPYRPFCSERCKLIDFGNWANEEYAVPTEEPLPDNDQEE